jgi:methionyl-tRNA formyltransferase
MVHFDRPALQVVNHVHGMTPWPGASIVYQNADGRSETVLLTRVRKAEVFDRPTRPPGTLDRRLLVAAEDGFVEILEIKPASGRMMTWPDFVNGRHVRAGDRFVSPESMR